MIAIKMNVDRDQNRRKPRKLELKTLKNHPKPRIRPQINRAASYNISNQQTQLKPQSKQIKQPQIQQNPQIKPISK